ncbi:hypothetical protein H2203_002691 [Taxawa tesnikishii (nom. ined.)]|nr:hypothetical protein H2203_002691 [Dothideales sp. JES 119]
MTGVGAFFWILGPGVLEHSLLKQFIQERKNMKHILSSPEACTNRLSMDSAAAATLRLKQVDPARYGVPVHDSNVTEAMTSNDFDLVADRGMELHLEPSIQLQQDKTSPILDMDQVLKKASPEVLELARQAQEDIKNDSALDVWANSLPSKDAEIVTLGTGSSIPSKYRNVSATLLRVPGWGSMLFDCGENTLGQLKRVFPADELQEILKELRIIWISHMHADHHLGTVSVIKAWYQAEHNMRPGLDPNPQSPSFRAHEHMKYGTRLSVIAEPAMLHWLYEYSHVEDYGFTRLAPLCISNASSSYNNTSSLNWFIPPSTEDYNPLTTHEAWLDKLTRSKVPASAINLADIQSVAVYHCHGARAVSLTFLSGFKVSYSGDCRPSKAFMQIGKGSTVCIHEATFDDELRGDAQAKSHSTTSEALGVAAGMNAKAALLTHFSQRYQKVPVMEYTDRDDNAAEAMIVDEAVSANPDDAPDDAMDGPISDLAATAASSAGPPATASDNYRPLLPAEASSAATTVKLMSGTDMKVCVAFDYMRVKVGEIAQLEKFTPALLKLFAAEEKDVEADAAAAGGGNAKNKEKKQKPGKSKRNN